jgi:hypothetical protein
LLRCSLRTLRSRLRPLWGGPIVAIAQIATVVLAGLRIVLGAFGARQLGALRSISVRRRLHVRRIGAHHPCSTRTAAGISRTELGHGAVAAWDALQPATLFVGIMTAVTIWAIGARWNRLPAPLLGMIAATLLYYAIQFFLPEARLGPVVGVVPGGLPIPTALIPLAEVPWDPVMRHAPSS